MLGRGLIRAPEPKSYPTDAQAVEVNVQRAPSIQYLTLNSRDRAQTSTPGQSADQPWNKFRLQRPQNLMNAYATRIGVSEVRFPYYIPNVNSNNNKLWILAFNSAATLSIYEITVNPGFYNGTTLAAALNSIISGATTFGSFAVIQGFAFPFNPASVPLFIFNAPTSQMLYDPSLNNTSQSSLFALNPVGAPVITEEQYNNQPTLCGLMGFTFQQVIGPLNFGTTPFNSRVSDYAYTDYIDIVSDKFNQYAKSRDGSSDGGFNRSLICRLYLSDETGKSDGSSPFTIYRQFQNPKMVEWNKEAAVDWMDIALYDEYGELLPLPPNVLLPNNRGTIDGGSYPDFQITLLATQD